MDKYINIMETDFNKYSYIDSIDMKKHYLFNVRALEYQNRDLKYLNYYPYKINNLNCYFRGPDPKINYDEDNFICFVGAAQMFGCYCKEPFIKQLSDILNYKCLNLGIGGAGPNNFNKIEFIDIINKSKLCILQIMSGRSVESFAFKNKDGNVDYLFNNNLTFMDSFWKDNYNNIELINNCKDNLIIDYKNLISQIKIPIKLLYISTLPPNDSMIYPQFVDKDVIDKIRSINNNIEYIEYFKGTSSFNEESCDKYYPDQQMHNDITKLLLNKIHL